MGFEKTDDARRMMAALTERLAKFGLAIHDEKTRLIEFGRLPALARRQRGLRRPETFAFLGFTHYCGWTRDGRFIVKLKTQSKRLTRKLKALRQEAWRLMHVPLAVQHRWYTSVLLGHYGYYGRPQNFPALDRVPSGSAPHLIPFASPSRLGEQGESFRENRRVACSLSLNADTVWPSLYSYGLRHFDRVRN